MNNLTEMVFIVDKSGSMLDLVGDTIGGFNSMLKKYKDMDAPAYVSTVFFNDKSEVIHDRVKIADAKELTKSDYCPFGYTALIDAIGGAIHHIKNIHKYARPEDVPEHTVFVIITDGKENASTKYSSDDVKKLISQQSEMPGWEFLFLGANIDAVETAASIGIKKDRSVDFIADKKGMGWCMDSLSNGLAYLFGGEEISANWSSDIKSDYEQRKNSKKR